MNQQLRTHLEAVVNSVINEDTDAAIKSFESYIKLKTQHILESGSDIEGDISRFDDEDEASPEEGDLDGDGRHTMQDHELESDEDFGELESDDVDLDDFDAGEDDYSDGRYE